MELFLIRHSEALALGERGVTEDEERPLSDKGEQLAEALGRTLAKRQIAFDLVLSSPLLRAKQTTELMLKAAGQSGIAIEFTTALAPDARPKKLSRHLLKSNDERIALVGHLPHLALFAAWVIGDKRAEIELAKPGLAHISCNDSPIKASGALHALITPQWFD